MISVSLHCSLNVMIMLLKLFITERPVPKPLIPDKHKIIILLIASILA